MSLFVETGEIDLSKDYFPELVGEGKKYKTNQDAGRALMEKDLTIKQREQELVSVRATLAERVKLEELLTQMNSKANQSPNSGSDNQNANGTNQLPPTAGITPEQFDERLNKKLAEERAALREQQNLESVKPLLQQKFGTEVSSKLKEEAIKLKMTPEQLEQVAATNPVAFSRLVGLEPVKQTQTLINPPTGMSTPFVPVSTGERTQSWYKELRKRDPVSYASREIQNQEHKDAERLGESFFDA